MKRWTAACVAAALVLAAVATSTLTTSASADAATAPSADDAAPGPATPAAPTTDVASVSTADLATLAGSVPLNYRYQCSLTDPNIAGDLVKPEFGHIRAFLQCFGVNSLRLYWYALFDDNASLDRAYRAYVGNPDPDRPYRDENAQCPGESGWGFGGAQDQGLLDCYYTSSDATGTDYGGETVVLVWKYDKSRILAPRRPRSATTTRPRSSSGGRTTPDRWRHRSETRRSSTGPSRTRPPSARCSPTFPVASAPRARRSAAPTPVRSRRSGIS